jgi:2-oxoglutarate dehydrogenase E1 component
MQHREDKGINDVALSRLEQISPFPYDLVRRRSMRLARLVCLSLPWQVTPHLDFYPNADLMWCQVCKL